MGLDAETIAAIMAALGAGQEDGVLPQNVATVSAFLAVASQWRTILVPTEMSVRTVFVGLDYAGARVALDALGIAVDPALWAGLAVMEQAAAAALNGEAALS